MVVLALVVLGAGAVAGWTAWRSGDDYRHTLERYGDEDGEPNVYVNLPDGEAQLALGSPDGHRLVVQWRDPDGHGWTKPETVWEDKAHTAIENTVRYGDGTAAIVETYVEDTSSDSDVGNVQVAVVCRDRECEARRGLSSQAQVTPDGSTAFLGATAEGALFWSSSDGFRKEPWSDPSIVETISDEPVLAPDGSLRAVTASRVGRGCTFALHTSGPRDGVLTAAAEHTGRLRGRGWTDCGTYTQTWSDDWLQVDADDHRVATFWFVREGEAWSTTHEDASGLDLIDVDRGCCASATAGFIHWNEVTFGSPDGRRIQVQSHLLGEERWSDPLVLEGAPTRRACDYMDVQEAGPEGAVVVMRCRDGYALAASTDLREWTSTYYRGPEGEPIGGDDGLRIADVLVWTPADGFVS